MVNDTNRDYDGKGERDDERDGSAPESDAAAEPPPNLLEVIRRLILDNDG